MLDLLTVPRELLPRFALYRGVSTALLPRRSSSSCAARRPSGWSFLYGYAIAVVVGGAIVLMTVDLGGFDSRYYAGLNLVIAAINLLLPWRPLHSAMNGALVIGMYVAANALFGGPFQVGILVSNLYFMVATVVIAVAITLREARADPEGVRPPLRAARRQRAARRVAAGAEGGARRALGRDGGREADPDGAPARDDRGRGRTRSPPRCSRPPRSAATTTTSSRRPGGRHWIAVGDVSGHGVESGLVMMMTQTAILSLVRQRPGLGPAGVFRAVNGVLCENISRLGGNRYMTLNVVRLDDEGLTLAGQATRTSWSGGRRRGASRRSPTRGAGSAWSRTSADRAPESFVPMDAGDAALFFTDGVTEARSERARCSARSGSRRPSRALRTLPPAEAIGAIVEEVAAFAHRAGRRHDAGARPADRARVAAGLLGGVEEAERGAALAPRRA